MRCSTSGTHQSFALCFGVAPSVFEQWYCIAYTFIVKAAGVCQATRQRLLSAEHAFSPAFVTIVKYVDGLSLSLSISFSLYYLALFVNFRELFLFVTTRNAHYVDRL